MDWPVYRTRNLPSHEAADLRRGCPLFSLRVDSQWRLHSEEAYSMRPDSRSGVIVTVALRCRDSAWQRQRQLA